MRSFLLGVLLITSLFATVSAQRICGTVEYQQQIIQDNPSLQSIFQGVENQMTSANANMAKRDTTLNEIIYIPVVIHILFKNQIENISDEQIKSQLDALNKDYRMQNADRANTPKAFQSLAGDARIQFCLAQVDPQGNKTTGIVRKYTNQDLFITDDGMKNVSKGGAASWDSKRYLNIWICKLSSRSLGYATPPGAAADKDGVVIAYDVFGTIGGLRAGFNKGRTATHEVGHWLGLIHIWGDANCGDDHVDDTPPQQSFNFGCQSFPKVSACSKDKLGDMFMNFMDFSDDACMNMFTKGQVNRMRSLFAKNNLRNTFMSSTACDSTSAVAGPLPKDVDNETALGAAPLSNVKITSIKIYPTPVITTTTIDCKGATALTVKRMNIFNSLGLKVFTVQLNQEKTIINLSHLVAGIYFIQIGEGADKYSTRIIKE